MAIKIFSIMQRNLLVFTHSKLSSLIIILGPIFLILLIGLGLANTGIRDLNAGVYTLEKSNFTESFINNLKGRSFIVTEYQNLDDCITSVKNSENVLCIELKKSPVEVIQQLNISKEEVESSGIGYSVHLYNDFSKQRVVWGIINKVSGSVEDFSSNIRTGASFKLRQNLDSYSQKIKDRRAQIANVISKLDDIQSKIPEIRSNLNTNDNDINRYLIELENNINIIRQNDSELVSRYLSSFFLLKDAWNSASYNQNLNLIKDSIDDIDSKIGSAKQELYSIDEDLKDLQDNIDYTKKININYLLSPIPMSYESVSGDLTKKLDINLNNFDFLFPTFLSFFILFVSLILTTNFIIKERTSKSYIRNVLSKTSGLSFIFGNFLTILLIVLVQCLIILFLASFFLQISLFSNLFSLFVVIIIYSSIMICMGMILGYIFNSLETAMIASISLSLFFIIFSPMITPLETMPGFFKSMFQYTPLILAEDIFKRILIFDVTLYSNATNLITLFLTFITAFIVTNIVYYKNKIKEIA